MAVVSNKGYSRLYPVLFISVVTQYFWMVVFEVSKIRLHVSVRKQGSRIESVPLKRLVKLSGLSRRRWEFKDGWLILEAS